MSTLCAIITNTILLTPTFDTLTLIVYVWVYILSDAFGTSLGTKCNYLSNRYWLLCIHTLEENILVNSRYTERKLTYILPEWQRDKIVLFFRRSGLAAETLGFQEGIWSIQLDGWPPSFSQSVWLVIDCWTNFMEQDSLDTLTVICLANTLSALHGIWWFCNFHSHPESSDCGNSVATLSLSLSLSLSCHALFILEWIYVPVCLPIYLSIYLSICLSVCLSVLPAHPSNHQSIYLPVSVSVHVSVYL